MKTFRLKSLTVCYEVREDDAPPMVEERTFTTDDAAMPSMIRHAMQTITWWLTKVLSYQANEVEKP